MKKYYKIVLYSASCLLALSNYCNAMEPLPDDVFPAVRAGQKTFQLLKAGGSTIIDLNSSTLLETLANLKPNEQRYPIMETSVAPVAKLIAQLAAPSDTTFDGLKAEDQQAFLIVLSAALAFGESGAMENPECNVTTSGIKAHAGRRNGSMIIWEGLKNTTKQLFRSIPSDQIDSRFAQIAEKAASPSPVQLQAKERAVVDPLWVITLNSPAGTTPAKINFKGRDVDNQLRMTKPNTDRFLVGNQFVLTPTQVFIAKYLEAVLDADAIKKDAEFLPFLTTVAAYLKLKASSKFENSHVHTFLEEGEYNLTGFKTNGEFGAIIKGMELMTLYERIKITFAADNDGAAAGKS